MLLAHTPRSRAWFTVPHYNEEGELTPTTLDGKCALLAMDRAGMIHLGNDYYHLLRREVQHEEAHQLLLKMENEP